MSDNIKNPYIFKKEEVELIKLAFTNHNDWDKAVFNDLRVSIRDALRTEQNNKCCYCKRELGYDIKEVDIEHIIPKATFEAFTFEPKNLALSCPACNTIKGDKVVLKRRVVKYPKNSKNFIIVHAHFDDYNEHIIIHEGLVFEAISVEGSHTITVCELFRLKIVEKRAKEQKEKVSLKGALTSLINGASKEELVAALSEVAKRIK